MGDVQACAPDWRDAQTYQPFLGADPSVWAWEFARRGLEQPGSATRFDPHAGRPPELCFVGDGPPGDPLPIALWRWQSDGSTPVFSVEPASVRDPAAIDLKGLDAATLVVRTADGDQHVLVSDGERRLRLAVVQGDVLAGPSAFRFHLPALAMGVGSLEGLRPLIALRDTGRLAWARAPAPAKAPRWLQILRVHDARRDGASHRDIAVSLFGEARVREDWGPGSDYMRMRVQRLVRAAEQTVAGGYRALFGLRRTGLEQPSVVQVWRSPRWSGGLLPVLLCVSTFLGTSFSSPQSWRELRQLSGTPRQNLVEPSRTMATTASAPRKSRSGPAGEGGADSSKAS
jgi:hypothetical protein